MSEQCSVYSRDAKCHGGQVTVIVLNVRGSSVREMLHVSLLAHRILMWLLEFWKICKPLAIGHVICMYSTLAVSASCNIVTYKGMSILRTYTHIYRGFCTVFVTDICTGMSMHTVLQVCCRIFYRVLQDFTDVNWKLLGDAGLGLGPYGPARSSLVCRSHFDTGYANIRQDTYLSAKFKEKSCLAFK